MTTMISDLLLNHRSIRKFDARPIAPELLSKLIGCAQMAPTSSFVQAYSIIHVTDLTKKAQLAEISGQAYVQDNAALLVFVADYYRHQVIGEQAGKDMSPGIITTEAMIVATVDATLAAQNLAIAAEAEGLGYCYIGSLRNDMQKVIQILELPKFTYPLYGLVLGYPAQEGSVKPRLPKAEVLHENTYQTTKIKENLTQYDDAVNHYYAERDSGKRQDDWTTQMVTKFTTPTREDVDRIVKKQGFLQK